MADRSDRTRLVAIGAAIGVLILLIAYLLAPGPLDWLLDNGYISIATRDRIGPLFYPLRILASNCPWYRDFIEWWSRQWAG